jgi:hypothetical protein
MAKRIEVRLENYIATPIEQIVRGLLLRLDSEKEKLRFLEFLRRFCAI